MWVRRKNARDKKQKKNIIISRLREPKENLEKEVRKQLKGKLEKWKKALKNKVYKYKIAGNKNAEVETKTKNYGKKNILKNKEEEKLYIDCNLTRKKSTRRTETEGKKKKEVASKKHRWNTERYK